MLESTQSTLSTALSHLTIKDALIFFCSTIAIVAITRFIESFSGSIVNKYPNKRMGILRWIPFINFFIYFGGYLMVFLSIFQPTKEYFFGFLASALIAIGFVLRDIIQSIVAGIVLLIDKPFQIGSRVTFAGYEGEIIHIGLRSTKLITRDKNIIIISNYRFLHDIVITHSQRT